MLLRFISNIYALITTLRNDCFEREWLKSYTSTIPVISVGNLTLGGNAKTPLAMYLAAELSKKNLRVIILTRGYKSHVKSPYLVLADDSANKVGDEALLMARNTDALVVIDPDRVRGIRYAEKLNLADVVILDDGYQHRYLNRLINLLAIDVSSSSVREKFLQGKMFPLGRFRENSRRGLARADSLILVNRSLKPLEEDLDQFINKLNFTRPIFSAGIVSSGVKNVISTKLLAPQKIVAFCGLATPESFFSSLEYLGFELVYKKSFPDHYAYRASDIKDLRSAYPTLPFVCTEKDLVKLSDVSDLSLYVLSTEIKFDEPEKFNNFIDQKLSSR